MTMIVRCNVISAGGCGVDLRDQVVFFEGSDDPVSQIVEPVCPNHVTPILRRCLDAITEASDCVGMRGLVEQQCRAQQEHVLQQIPCLRFPWL